MGEAIFFAKGKFVRRQGLWLLKKKSHAIEYKEIEKKSNWSMTQIHRVLPRNGEEHTQNYKTYTNIGAMTNTNNKQLTN